MNTLYEKAESIFLIVDKWPLQLFSIQISSDTEHALGELTSSLEIALESNPEALEGGYEIGACISACRKLLGVIRRLGNNGIVLTGAQEVVDHLDEIIPVLKAKQDALNDMMQNSLNGAPAEDGEEDE